MTEKYTEKKAIETVCFTGHRHIDRSKALLIPTKLKEILEDLISRGAVRFRAGGAWGFDTVAALCVIELQMTHPEISLELVLPCRDQASFGMMRAATCMNTFSPKPPTSNMPASILHPGVCTKETAGS
jgi:hypothetical protein